MNVEIRRPVKRTCIRCGREERWDDDATAWQVANEVGEVFCIHDWDITGDFTPVER
ncbi:MAG: HEWD family protein [Halodesulfurarchaeum sp.]